MKLIISFTNLQTAAGQVQNDVHVLKRFRMYKNLDMSNFQLFVHVSKRFHMDKKLYTGFSGIAPVHTNPGHVEMYPFPFCENDTLTIH